MNTNETVKAAKCMNPYCDNTKVYARGICNTCYQAARLRILSGQTTWDTLVADGKVLPAGNGKPMGKFTQWLSDGPAKARLSTPRQQPTTTKGKA